MKKNWKKLLLIPLLLAVVAAPVCAQDNAATGAGSNPQAVTAPPVAPSPPTPEAASASNDQTTTTNANDSHKNNAKDDSDSTPVRIDATGVHIGGSDPVDITIPGMGGGMPKMMGGMPQHGPTFDLPFGIVLISLAGILTPFIFLAVVISCILYFKHRRNRMLHETLRTMIDKGVPIPPELIVPPGRQFRRSANSDLRNGLIMVGLGIGIFMFHLRFGWIPIFIGLAFLVVWLIERTQSPKDGQQNK